MTNPTTQQMREWLSAASPQTKIKYQWVGILLGRLEQVQMIVDESYSYRQQRKHKGGCLNE